MTVLGCVLAAVLTVAAAAQEPKSSSPDTSAVSVLKPVPDSGKFKITPLLAPAYNPEMQYLIAGGDGSMYLRWDHQLLRPSDGEVDPFREGRTMAVGTSRLGAAADQSADRGNASATDE